MSRMTTHVERVEEAERLIVAAMLELERAGFNALEIALGLAGAYALAQRKEHESRRPTSRKA